MLTANTILMTLPSSLCHKLPYTHPKWLSNQKSLHNYGGCLSYEWVMHPHHISNKEPVGISVFPMSMSDLKQRICIGRSVFPM